MKIKRRDLVRLIREMSLDEMAYLGMPNVQRGLEVPRPPARRFISNPMRHTTDLSKIERYFRSPNFAKKATKFFGEDRGFPGSNVWIIPQIGDPRSPELQFNKDEPDYDPNRSYSPMLMTTPGRGAAYNVSEKLLKSLGMSEEGITSVDFANDIIFVPRASKISGGRGNYLMSSPHMIIHSLFDDGVLSKLPEVQRAMILAERMGRDDVDPGGKIWYYIKEINHPDGLEFIGLVAPVTAALRNEDASNEDITNEILTGCLLYRGLEKIKVDSKYDAYIREKTGMGVKELISLAVEASREFLKGKIVLVEVL